MSKQRVEFGDWQTPSTLAEQVCSLLSKQGLRPASIVEPTCGVGAFVLAGLETFKETVKILAVEIDKSYADTLEQSIQERDERHRTCVKNEDFFNVDWHDVIGSLPQPVLLLGNPPWVTNSVIGAIEGSNLPKKSNFQGMSGFDAVTGKSNFDISEWMLICLTKAMIGVDGSFAMLCKSSVARKVLKYIWKNDLSIASAEIRKIDAKQHFDASVDACLFVCAFSKEQNTLSECPVYGAVDATTSDTVIGYDRDMLIADMECYERQKHLLTNDVTEWRSGVKHDASKVMEFRKEGDGYRNGFDEVYTMEEEYIYPLLKSSDVASNRPATRYVLVTQKTPSDETLGIAERAPKTWDYLVAHAELLDGRGSIVYCKRPRFAVFGIGDYAFAPYKVAVSGFYSGLKFRVIEPVDGKPTMLDDTIYFLPFDDKDEAVKMADALNSEPIQEFLRAFVFPDAKRPITIELLKRLDVSAWRRSNYQPKLKVKKKSLRSVNDLHLTNLFDSELHEA